MTDASTKITPADEAADPEAPVRNKIPRPTTPRAPTPRHPLRAAER